MLLYSQLLADVGVCTNVFSACGPTFAPVDHLNTPLRMQFSKGSGTLEDINAIQLCFTVVGPTWRRLTSIPNSKP